MNQIQNPAGNASCLITSFIANTYYMPVYFYHHPYCTGENTETQRDEGVEEDVMCSVCRFSWWPISNY